MDEHAQQAPAMSEEAVFLLAEYEALRDERVKRVEIRHQLISLTLLVAGTFLTIGVQATVSVSVLLIYPIIALFLAAGWAQNDVRVSQIAVYIRDVLEPHFHAQGWEHYRYTRRIYTRWGLFGELTVTAARGVFLSTQILTVTLALVRSPQLLTDLADLFMPSRFGTWSQEAILLLVLFVLDLLAILATLFLPQGARGEKQR